MKNIAIIGFGTVGQGFAELLHEGAATYGDKFRITAVVTRSRGTLYRAEGLRIPALLHAIGAGSLDEYPEADGLLRGLNALTIIRKHTPDVVVELTHSDFETAQPALDHIRTALEHGCHVITANKGPIALHYDELKSLAAEKSVLLRFEGTVMAGTPTMATALESLAGSGIKSVRGILNGSTNYIITRMEAGLAYDTAIKEASELGYLEADPSADLDGWDAAGKVLILAASIFGAKLKMTDLSVRGIRELTGHDIADAASHDERYRLIAEVRPDGGSVQLMRLPVDDPLALVSGSKNAVTFSTRALGDVTLIGAGAGRQETGYAVLTDLLSIDRYTSKP